jgi:hypothetical protein
MISNYDRWATKEGPGFSPIEMNFSDWIKDVDADNIYAPFDETHCNLCNTMIGAYLDIDPDTTADVFSFKSFWIVDEDCEKLFCEDCYLELTEEVV